MSRRRIIMLSGAAIGIAVFGYFFPPFRIAPIDEEAHAQHSRANASASVNVKDYVEDFWSNRLPDALDDAVDIEELYLAVDRDAEQASDQFGRQVGLGGATFFFVRGTGRVEEVAAGYCTLRIGRNPRPARLETGVVIGNTVRDSTGLIDVSQFANSQDFNNLSVELNERVETEVLTPSRDRLQVGARVTFVGCAKVDGSRDFDPLTVTPIHLDIEAPELTR